MMSNPPVQLRRPRGLVSTAATPRLLVVSFALGHAPLALIMYNQPRLATLHAIGTLTLGTSWAVFGRSLRRIFYVSAYVAACDVFWRMIDAAVFWEGAKYALVLFLGMGLLRFLHAWRGIALPFIYALALLPGIWISADRLGWGDELRQYVSFNLSGPLALGVAILFFLQVRPTTKQITTALWSILGPIVGVAAIASYSTFTATTIDFGTESNFVTSGGFGPNQVSAMLSAGALVAILLAVGFTRNASRWIAVLLALWFVSQGMLTFSRGGLYNLFFALIFSAVHFLRRHRFAFLVAASSVLLIFSYLILPRLDGFTEGALSVRFTDTDPTNRWDIINQDIEIWKANPILGVGPGVASFERDGRTADPTAAHTEFSRLLAEHGLLGAVALGALLSMMIASYRRVRAPTHKAVVIALIVWSIVEMSHSAMRLAIIPLFIGLAAARPWEEETVAPSLSEHQALQAARLSHSSPTWSQPEVARQSW